MTQIPKGVQDDMDKSLLQAQDMAVSNDPDTAAMGKAFIHIGVPVYEYYWKRGAEKNYEGNPGKDLGAMVVVLGQILGSLGALSARHGHEEELQNMVLKGLNDAVTDAFGKTLELRRAAEGE